MQNNLYMFFASRTTFSLLQTNWLLYWSHNLDGSVFLHCAAVDFASWIFILHSFHQKDYICKVQDRCIIFWVICNPRDFELLIAFFWKSVNRYCTVQQRVWNVPTCWQITCCSKHCRVRLGRWSSWNIYYESVYKDSTHKTSQNASRIKF